MALFHDRAHAGRVLSERLAAYAGRPDVIVLGLPRGGVPVAEQVAAALGADLDVFVVRKIGVPGFEELAMGAVASGGVSVINQEVVARLNISDEMFESVAREAQGELEVRAQMYRGSRGSIPLSGRTVILVDDGLATGATMRAAVQAVRMHRPARIEVAVPVAAPDACEELKAVADAVTCASTPEQFLSVGVWYEDFSQTSDEEVRDALARRGRPEERLEPSSPPV
jgi:putative phosphoribosyl transferase